MLLAIDPGTDTGWAYFNGAKQLAYCGLAQVGDEHPTAPPTVIIECPRLRPHGEKNPNAILLVARNAGEWGGRYAALGATIKYVTPNEWKGSVPKDISQARSWGILSEPERTIVDTCFKSAKGRNGMAPSKRHNVLDAIGIGLWAVGR